MVANDEVLSQKANLQTKELLIRNAGLGIYKENSFNKLALPVHAPTNEIAKRQQLVEISLKTGAAIPPGKGISFFQDLISDIYELQKIAQRLQNPESRLIDEFFWFWPIPPASEENDQGLDHLRSRDLESALAYWQDRASSGDRHGVALHNLAICTHLWILEQESSIPQAPPNATVWQYLDKRWDDCYQYWQALIDCEAFWSQFSNRIREIDDPRLTTGSARRIRSLLPFFLNTTHLKIALGHAENEQFDQARRLVSYVRQSRFLGESFSDVSQVLLESHRKRLREVCKSAEKKVEASPQNASQSAVNLITVGQTSLKLLDLFSPGGVDFEMHDLVVETTLAAVRSYGATTEKYEHCLQLLSDLKPLAARDENRNEVEETVKDIQDLISKADFWCGERYFDLPTEILDMLERARTLAGQLKYQDAINLINDLKGKYSAQVSTVNKNIVEKPLAYCLNRQAVEILKKVTEVLDRPREIFVNIARRAQQTKQSQIIEAQFNYALWGYENNCLDYVRQNGQLYCMACGKQVRDTNFSAFMNNDLPVVICWSCNHSDNQELARRKAVINTLMLEGHKLLSMARQLNPDNNLVKENLAFLRKMANQLRITLPADPTVTTPAPKANRSKSTGKAIPASRERTKPAAKSRPRNANLTSILMIAVLTILMVLILSTLCLFAALVAADTGNSSFLDGTPLKLIVDQVMIFLGN